MCKEILVSDSNLIYIHDKLTLMTESHAVRPDEL